jgi:hypothetical protein
LATCPNCGVRVAKTASFCRKCGFSLEVEEPQVEASEKAQSEVSTPESKCDNHPERDAVGTCVDCGKGICFFCRTVLKGNNYCPACIDKVLRELRADESAAAHTELSIPDIKCPKCPLCGSETLLRTFKKGSHAGNKFFICLYYPDCEGKVEYDAEVEHRRPPSPECDLSTVWTYGVKVGAIWGIIFGLITVISERTYALENTEDILIIVFIFPFLIIIGVMLGVIITLITALLYQKSKDVKSPRFIWIIVVGLGTMVGVLLAAIILPDEEFGFVRAIIGSMPLGILGAALGWVATKMTVTPNIEQSLSHPALRSVLYHCISFTAIALIISTFFVIVAEIVRS